MKPKDFSAALISAADLMNEPQLAQLAGVIGSATPATVTAIFKKMTPSTPNSANIEGPMLRAVGKLERFISQYGATTLKADIKALHALLKEVGRIDVNEFEALMKSSLASSSRASRAVVAPNDEGIRIYLRQFEVALGDDDGFKALHRKLASDESMAKGDVISVARQFSGKGGKSKADALKNILQRHQTLMGLRAKEQSRDGRSAA